MKTLDKIEHKGITIDPNFCQMYNNAGNRKVTAIIKKCITKVMKGTTKDEIQSFALDLIDKLSRDDRYGEVYDTEPRTAIQHYIVKAGNATGVHFNDLYI